MPKHRFGTRPECCRVGVDPICRHRSWEVNEITFPGARSRRVELKICGLVSGHGSPNMPGPSCGRTPARCYPRPCKRARPSGFPHPLGISGARDRTADSQRIDPIVLLETLAGSLRVKGAVFAGAHAGPALEGAGERALL